MHDHLHDQSTLINRQLSKRKELFELQQRGLRQITAGKITSRLICDDVNFVEKVFCHRTKKELKLKNLVYSILNVSQSEM